MTSDDLARITAIERPDPKLLTLYLVRSAFALVFFPVVYLPAYFKYVTLRYRFDDQGISMAWGLLWKREIFVTYARLQDIHITRGLVERWLGLATIDLQTASASAGAEMSIVGLTEYDAIRDYLYARMRGARFGENQDQAPVASRDRTADASAESEVVAMLGEIRDALVDIQRGLGKEAQ